MRARELPYHLGDAKPCERAMTTRDCPRHHIYRAAPDPRPAWLQRAAFNRDTTRTQS